MKRRSQPFDGMPFRNGVAVPNLSGEMDMMCSAAWRMCSTESGCPSWAISIAVSASRRSSAFVIAGGQPAGRAGRVTLDGPVGSLQSVFMTQRVKTR